MKILALVPARGGSKRLSGKNILPLGGKPLIAWSIDVARDIPQICDALVSTDDPAIANVARQAGALVPWMRPAQLATDTATSLEVALHALDWYENEYGKVDGLLLLQPTSPFRRRSTVLKGIEFFAMRRRPVVSVSPAKSHPMWCYRIEGDAMRPFVESGAAVRSQDLPPAYVANGAFYLIAPQDLRALQSFHDDDTLPLVMDDPVEAIDIDTEWDWKMAELMLASSSAELP